MVYPSGKPETRKESALQALQALRNRVDTLFSTLERFGTECHDPLGNWRSYGQELTEVVYDLAAAEAEEAAAESE